jgi:hypothetical protein
MPDKMQINYRENCKETTLNAQQYNDKNIFDVTIQ